MNNKDKHKLVEKIIDELINKADGKEVVTSWGEPAILLCDVINLINNAAETDYKRYWSYNSKVKSSDCKPNRTNQYCGYCMNYWRNTEDKQGCLGIKIKNNENNDDIKGKPCEHFISKIKLLEDLV